MIVSLLNVTIVGDSASRFRWEEPIFESSGPLVLGEEKGGGAEEEEEEEKKKEEKEEEEEGRDHRVSAGKKRRCVEMSEYTHNGHVREKPSNSTVECPDLCQRCVRACERASV